MSRIGKKPIIIPKGVEVKIEKETIFVKGLKGELKMELTPVLRVELKEENISVSLDNISKKNKAMWGLTRALIANMVKGVTEGFEKRLQLEGVGYRAKIEGNQIVLNVGFSHPVNIEQPEGIKYAVEKNVIIISGINKELVGQMAAKIRDVQPPEPYKGKGIRYVGEQVRRKAGKKVVTAGT